MASKDQGTGILLHLHYQLNYLFLVTNNSSDTFILFLLLVSKMTKSITCGSSGIRKYIIGAAVGVALFVVLRFGVGYVLRRNHTPSKYKSSVIYTYETINTKMVPKAQANFEQMLV